MKFDTTNKFMVSSNGSDILILSPKSKMTQDEALNLACWLLALTDFSPHEVTDAMLAIGDT